LFEQFLLGGINLVTETVEAVDDLLEGFFGTFIASGVVIHVAVSIIRLNCSGDAWRLAYDTGADRRRCS